MNYIMFTDLISKRTIILVSLLFSLLACTLINSAPAHAQAVNFAGPTDTTTRYALEYSATTQAISITVPVYFPAQPTSAKIVNVNSFVLGRTGLYARFASINVGTTVSTPVNLSSNGSFSIPPGNFTYDPVARLWKARVTVSFQGYIGQDYDHYMHFRMQLADTSGYISYGGGYFQAVSVDYPDRDTSKLYSLYMATPCDVRVNTTRRVSFYDLDHRNRDNGDEPVTVRITDVTNPASPFVVAIRSGDSYPVSVMGQDGILDINMTFVPGHKYRVDVWNIAGTNVIQYDFPYDNIAYVVPICPTPQWDTSGTSSSTNTGVVTTDTPTVTFTHTIRNLITSADATDKAINAEIFQTINGGAPTSRGTFSRASGLPPGGSFTDTDNISTAGYIGQVICQYVRWFPAIWSSSATRQTTPVCVTIAAVPRMSIVGGDAATGGSFGTGSTCGTTPGGFRGFGNSPGSFGEYGLLAAPGVIDEFYSAGAGLGLFGRSLSFANGPLLTSPLGNYDTKRCVKNLEPQLTMGVTLAAGYLGPSLPAPGSYQVSAATIDIGGATLTGGPRLIVSNGDVRITGNLTYGVGPFARFADVPSLVIIANNISFAPGVTQVDGLFIARNNVSTCSDAGLSTGAVQANRVLLSTGPGGVCRNARLAVNGAIIANGELVPARSAGGENAGSAPAEIIKFRPEVFLSPLERGTASVSLKTDSETELPPRN